MTPYSKLDSKQLVFINNIACLEDGFTIMKYENEVLKCFTFYNDNVSSYRQRFTIAHEIKHVIFKEFNPSEKQEDLANHFARYILAPTCMVMRHLSDSPYEIASLFDISLEAANNALTAANNRFNSGYLAFEDYEISFLKEAIEK